jgi:hypothetical protein
MLGVVGWTDWLGWCWWEMVRNLQLDDVESVVEWCCCMDFVW